MGKRWLILFFLIFGLGWLIFIRLGDLSYILKISREDGFVESLTAIFYLIGFIVGVRFIYVRRRLALPIFLPVIWTILCFLFLGEETSWFQRIFNYSVSSVESISNQSEFNIHNLKIFKGRGLIKDGELNKSVSEILMSSQNLFRLGFFGYFLFLPIFLNINRIKMFLTKIGYVRPSAFVFIVLLVVFVSSFVLVLFSPIEFKSPIAESREMLYSLFILIYIIVYMGPKREAVVP